MNPAAGDFEIVGVGDPDPRLRRRDDLDPIDASGLEFVHDGREQELGLLFVTVLGKGRKTRQVPLGRYCIDAIRAWLARLFALPGIRPLAT